ncbi:MAG: epoxyqueuosine reductase QueH [Lentisphaeria bacterium]|nr:epoxyqueuosine reductase QueH [Lentisphaeria bacterium]
MILHICCAPCGGGCVERVKEENLVPVLFYSNSNLNSAEEFERRLESVKKLASDAKIELHVDPYDHEAWLQAVAGLEDEPEHGARCRKCFRFSLERCANFAAGKDFCTTLTVSPHKDSKVIFDIGSEWENFVPCDFKKHDGYRRSCEIARQSGFYRQKYCGCEFSLTHSGGKK